MLFRKMSRDIKNNLTQFISIFIMSLLGVLVYSGINAEWYGMRLEADRYYEETNLADLWVISTSFTEEDIINAKKIPGVSEAALRLTLDAAVADNSDQTLRINVIKENTLSIPSVVEGMALDTSADGLWLDDSFARENNLQVGDKITFKVGEMTFNKNILGLILHPEYVHNVKDDSSFIPNPKLFGFAFMYPPSISKDIKIPYNQMLIAKNTSSGVKSITSSLENLFSDRYMMVLDRSTHPSVAAFEEEIQQNKAMGGVFPIVFFLIAALTMLTTMTRLTNNQRTQIGTLKALGFSRKKILIHYVSYGIWLGLLGGLIGLITGPLIIPPILYEFQKTMYTLPNWSAKVSTSSFAAVVLSVIACGASSYLACNKQLREVPAAALRPKAPKAITHSRLEKTALWHRCSFSVQWNLRDVMRSKTRSIMAVIGVMGCTSLLLFGLGLRDTVDNITTIMYEDFYVYENKLNLQDNITEDIVNKISNKYTGQWIQEANIQLRSNNKGESGSLTVLNKGSQINFKDRNGNMISLPHSGIAITYKMAELLDLKIGDTVQWRIFGERNWQQSKIEALYYVPMGQGIAIAKEEFEENGNEFIPTALLTRDDVREDNLFSEIKSVQNKTELAGSFDTILESMKMIIVILVAAAVILGSVVLYNLGALSFTERIRELATLKVLGFFPKQIRGLLQMQNVWLSCLGIIAGIPAAYALVDFMLSTMPGSMDMTGFISVKSIIISILGTFIVSVLVNLLLSRKVKDIDMVTALKSVE